MKSLKQFIREDYRKFPSGDMFLESMEEEKASTGHINFVQLQHYNDVTMESMNDSLIKEAKDSNSMLVNHGSYVLRGGKKVPLGGEVRSVDPVTRMELLKQGWQDAVPVERHDEKTGEYVRLGVDPRDRNDYFAKGYHAGWWKDQEVYDPKSHKHIPVFPEEYQKYIDKGWKDFEPIKVSKIEKTKTGTNHTDIRIIDKSLLDDYLNNGYQEGVVHSDDYYDSFMIRCENAKLGKHVGNFSTTPVESCPKGIPCAGDCYAKRCYDQYPECKEAWDKNLKILREHPDWLVADMSIFFMTSGKHLTKFRWSVSGDLLDANHLGLLNRIAEENPHVSFWVYTKNLDLLKGFTPARNLTVIISAWNEYRLDEIEKLHHDFPVAYFDDWNHKDLIPKDNDENTYICPCADDKVEDEANDKHCETCKTHSERKGNMNSCPCYMLKPGYSLIFRKH